MDIPLFVEVLFPGPGESDWIPTLEKAEVGKTPAYVNLTTLSGAECMRTVEAIHDALQRLAIHPRIPNPIYLVVSKTVPTTKTLSEFPIVRSLHELPLFYKKALRHPTDKEMELLGQYDLLCHTLLGHEVKTALHSLQAHSLRNRDLIHEIRIGSFFEGVARDLHVPAPKSREGIS